MGFCRRQLDRLQPLWQHMLEHPFLVEARDGTLDETVFASWLRQDYLFVRAALPFQGALLARAPVRERDAHAVAIHALQEELELFRERARALGIELEDVRPSLVNHAYVQFLLATAHGRSYPEGHTVLYVAEKAYHESWKVVREGLDASHPWWPFVENWSGEAFAAFVRDLEARQDRLAGGAGSALRTEMAELFETTVRYEIAFWEMAYSASGWPGIVRDWTTVEEEAEEIDAEGR